MLKSLKIQNVALIPQVEIEFGSGFNVLTGETGAGKSIVLGSLNFILGEKLGKAMIRSGETRCFVEAVFSNDLVLSRTLKLDGKSECRINGVIVTTSELQGIASELVNIHGQHDTEALLSVKNHISILDQFGQIQISEYRKEYDELKELERKLKSFGGDESERERQMDLLKFQINEIESVNLREGEDDELAELKVRMNNHEKIVQSLTQAVSHFDTEAVRSGLAALGPVSGLDSKLEKIYQDAKSVKIGLDYVLDDAQSYLDEMEFDESEFLRVDQRLDQIKSLKRKYGSSIVEIVAFAEQQKLGLKHLIESEKELENTKNAIQAKLCLLGECGEKLSEKRKEAARVLEHEILLQLGDLGMQSASFSVSFSRVKDNKLKSDGIDEIEFLFSANAGEPLRPLARIISGGEMSRFMLGLKCLVASSNQTLVFDEIDTGVGGRIAVKLAEKIAQLGKRTQVICVTHLHQVAVNADTHFLIEKREDGARTTTTVLPLGKDARAGELVRMRGE